MMEGYQKEFPECPEYVLDVPQATAVIFSRKVNKNIISSVVSDWGTTFDCD